MSTTHRPGLSAPGSRSRRRVAAAAGAALASSAALGLGAGSAHAQDPVWPVVTPAQEAAATLKASALLERREPFKPIRFCDRFPTACVLNYEERNLFPEPDPDPYGVELDHLVLPLQELDGPSLDFAALERPAFGG